MHFSTGPYSFGRARLVLAEDSPLKLRGIVNDGLRREDITEERVAQIRQEAHRIGAFIVMEVEEREAIRREVLRDVGPDEAVWIFAYGSLMWNPACHVADRVPGLIYGYPRSVCLSTPIGRGSPEQPGLMLGMEPGGSCRGLALRIDADHVESETQIVWRREMLSGAYRPEWVTVHTEHGPIRAVTFVINRRHERYVADLPEDETVKALATAEGQLGRCADYLHNLVLHLDELGIADGPMHRLMDRVETYRRCNGG